MTITQIAATNNGTYLNEHRKNSIASSYVNF